MYVTEIKCKSVPGHGMFGGHGRQNEMGDGGGEGGGKPSITNKTFIVPVLYDSNRISSKA